MTNEHTSLEKYTSHTLISKGLGKGWYWLCVRGGLETEQTDTYWPQVPLTIAALLSHSAGLLNWGSLRAASPLSGAGSHCLELQLELQQNQAVCGSLFDIHLLPVGVAIAPNSTRPQVKVTPRYLRPDAPVSWLAAGSWVNMLHSARDIDTCIHVYIYTHAYNHIYIYIG